MMRPAFGEGSRGNKTALMTLKMAVFAPMPRARVETAMIANPGFLINWREAKRMSANRFEIIFYPSRKATTAKDGGIRADAESQRQHSDCGKGRLLREHARGASQILQEPAHLLVANRSKGKAARD